jgi:hypothetical protein
MMTVDPFTAKPSKATVIVTVRILQASIRTSFQQFHGIFHVQGRRVVNIYFKPFAKMGKGNSRALNPTPIHVRHSLLQYRVSRLHALGNISEGQDVTHRHHRLRPPT